ncbi:MAG: multiple antibiotic resistance protein [Cyclobacteriaceae bacterium]|jgi:small neutral amino acid transporter SnatA (MarC family)
MFKNQLFFDSLGLMLFMLNPFLLIIYLIDLVEELDSKTFRRVLLRAALISTGCYIVFALIGDKLFDTIFNADFASFQIFGGIIFLITGIRYVFEGNKAVKKLRGEASYLQGGIVMPIMVGPGTISASIMIGQRVDTVESVSIILFSVITCISTVLILKAVYEKVHTKNEQLVLRYIDILGRVAALLIGTFSIEMIMRGIKSWVVKF